MRKLCDTYVFLKVMLRYDQQVKQVFCRPSQVLLKNMHIVYWGFFFCFHYMLHDILIGSEER